MIDLFVSDIDGCLAEPFQPYDVPRFAELAALVASSAGDDVMPAFSICSGRPLPYVEAVSQALGVQQPVLFEAGGGLYDPPSGRVTWHPRFTLDVQEAIEAVRRWMIAECVPGTAMMFDHSKRTQAGLIGPDTEEIAAYVPIVRGYVARHHPRLRVFSTDISIDALDASITKREGMGWLADRLGLSPARIAFIGDTEGDLGALEAVGYAFAPANAAEAVQAVARVTQARVLAGVLEAYRWCWAHNLAYPVNAS